jgi:hypothetical protein
MVAAGVIAGDNRDAFLRNKKKTEGEKRETEEFGILIPQFKHAFNLQLTAFYQAHNPHIAGTPAPLTHAFLAVASSNTYVVETPTCD